jgi:hypothetical protein
LRFFVAGAGISEKAVGREQPTKVELGNQVIRQRFRDLPTEDEEVCKSASLGVLTGDR